MAKKQGRAEAVVWGRKTGGIQGILTFRDPLKGSSRAQNDIKMVKMGQILLFLVLCNVCVTLTHHCCCYVRRKKYNWIMGVWDPRDSSPTSPERVQISHKMNNILLFPVLCNFNATLTPHLSLLSVEEEDNWTMGVGDPRDPFPTNPKRV